MRVMLTAVALLFALAAPSRAQTFEVGGAGAWRGEHEEWALQALFTKDGREVVSAGLDGRVRFWDAATGKLARELKAPSPVLSLALSPDGSRLAAGDARGVVSLWEVATGRLERELKTGARAVNAVAFNSDGSALAAGCEDGRVRVWPAAGGGEKPAAEVEAGGDVVSLVGVPGQPSRLALGVLNRKEPTKSGVAVLDWPTKERVHFFKGSPGVRTLAASPDGRLLAAAGFRPATLLSLVPVEGGQFEASVRVLGESDEPAHIAVWDLKTGKALSVFTAELGGAALAFSPDGRLLASAGEHGVLLFDAEVFLERGRAGSRTRVSAIAFDAPGARLAIARERERPGAGKGGPEGLLDPALVAAALAAKDAVHSGAYVAGPGASVTGGSTVEVVAVRERTSPESARLWEATRLLRGDAAAARAALEKLTKDFPSYGEARRVLAVLSKDGRGAREWAEGAVKADPACAACHRTLGDLLFNADEFAAAVASYRRALELGPEAGLVAGRLADALNRLALSRLKPDNAASRREAAALFEEALRLRPADAQIINNLASIHYFGRDLDGSIRLLELARRLRPDMARIHYDLGHSYRYKGRTEDAVRSYRRYVALGEPGEEARVERAKKIIEELTKKQ